MAEEVVDETVVDDEPIPSGPVRTEPSEDRGAFEAKVAANLAATMAKLSPEEDVSAEVETPATEKKEPTKETEAEAAAEPAIVAETTTDKNAPTLPAAYRRSLKAYEWTDEEIDSALKQGGQNFITTAGKLHSTRSKEVAQWAELGRQKRPDSTQSPAAETSSVIKPIDAKALKAKYGDEALIDELVGPMNKLAEQMNAMLPQVQAAQQQSQTARQEALGRQIDGFFGGKELESYKDTYGTETGKLNTEQLSSRNKVLELADALIGGAKLQGRNLSFDEAMTLAHDSVTGGTKEQAARTQIVKQLEKRQQAITLKPASRKIEGQPSAAKSRNELEKKVADRLKTAFA